MFLRFSLNLSAIFCLLFFIENLSFADEFSNEKLNNFLLQKKQKSQPFNEKDIKVDIESLGLDNVDKKSEPVIDESLPPELLKLEKKPVKKVKSSSKEVVGAEKNINSNNQQTKINSNDTSKQEDQTPQTKKDESKEELKNKDNKLQEARTSQEKEKDYQKARRLLEGNNKEESSKKISEDLKNQSKISSDLSRSEEMNVNVDQKPEKELTAEEIKLLRSRCLQLDNLPKKPVFKTSYKKKRVKNKKPKPKIRTKESAIVVRETKSNEIENLQKFYLDQIQNKNSQIVETPEINDDDKIVPQRKDLNSFILDELPALPILNRSRGPENIHIPYIMTPKEKIDVMFSAISLGSVTFFNEAYKNVQNPNIYNDQGDTILTYAILLKRYPIIASVLAKGADPNLPNKLGYAPVEIAIELVDYKSLEMLGKNKADLKYVDNLGRTNLMRAARVGFLPAVDLLVKNGVDVNAMDNDGFTALSIAYRHKKELIVQYLLKNGAKTWIERPYQEEENSMIESLKDKWK